LRNELNALAHLREKQQFYRKSVAQCLCSSYSPRSELKLYQNFIARWFVIARDVSPEAIQCLFSLKSLDCHEPSALAMDVILPIIYFDMLRSVAGAAIGRLFLISK